ncbi:MAG: sensor histidine kinase [Gemmatimonadaceae bacterium]
MEDDEEALLRETALKNAHSIFLARQRAEHELVRVTEALAEARDAAQAANDAKTRFVGMVSHELRTPLGAIGGYAALMEEEIHGPLSDDQRHLLSRIRHNQLHLLRLVDELLDLAKIESGQFGMRPTVVHIGGVVENVRQMIEPQLSAGGLRFEVGANEGNPKVRADAERVEQIVLNLLANAVKFTPSGGTISVWSEVREAEVFLHVRDTGPGIPPDKLEEVFQPFVQLRAPAAPTVAGTGLGLAISRELARAMRGGLSCKSEPGAGSSFTLRLPVHSSD